jgi:hypothetical protein
MAFAMWLDIFDALSIRHLNQIANAMFHFAVAPLPQRQKWHADCFIQGTIEELAFWLTIRL